MIVGTPLMAALARRWPARTTLLFFVVMFAVTHIVGAVTTSFAVLLVTRVIAALADAGFLAVALRAAAALVAADRKGRALAVLLSGTTIATVAGTPGGALLGTLLGYRATFWTIALLCIPAAIGVGKGIPADAGESMPDTPALVSLRTEFAQLTKPGLILVILLASLVNAATFATFTFLAPIVTGTAGLGELWVPVVLTVFGARSFVGVTLAGRFSDQRPGIVIAVCGPVLLLGWIALATQAAHPVALLVLAFTQGALSFALGSTVITRVLYEAEGAPTMGGAYATAALNIGAAGGPAIAATTLGSHAGNLGPVWASSFLVAVTLVIALPLLRVIAPRVGQVIR